MEIQIVEIGLGAVLVVLVVLVVLSTEDFLLNVWRIRKCLLSLQT